VFCDCVEMGGREKEKRLSESRYVSTRMYWYLLTLPLASTYISTIRLRTMYVISWRCAQCCTCLVGEEVVYSERKSKFPFLG